MASWVAWVVVLLWNVLCIDNRVDTNETATSVLEHQSYTAGNEAIVEEDEGAEAMASAAAAQAASKDVTQSADSDTVLNKHLFGMLIKNCSYAVFCVCIYVYNVWELY